MMKMKYKILLHLVFCAGPSLSVINILTRARIGRCFTTNYGTAVGIGTSGGSLGVVAAGPLTQWLLDTYGWRGTLLLLGALILNLCVCGTLLQSSTTETKTNGGYQPVGAHGDEEPRAPGNVQQPRLGAAKDAFFAQMKHFGLSICGKILFWIDTVVFICIIFVSDLWAIYFVSLAEAKGFSPYDAVTFTSVAGVSSMISKLGFGFIVDRGWLKLRPAILLMTVLSSLSLLVTPWINSLWPMMASAYIYIGASSALAPLNDLYTRELLGADLLACAFGWMKVVAAVVMFSLGFFPGKDISMQMKKILSFQIFSNIRGKDQTETRKQTHKHVSTNTGYIFCLTND